MSRASTCPPAVTGHGQVTTTGGTVSKDPRPHEDDVEPDSAQALSRATGGVENAEMPDQGSTTGTTPSGEFVGRVAGQDVGYAEDQGGERLARFEREQQESS
jgi:hypothetical protein